MSNPIVCRHCVWLVAVVSLAAPNRLQAQSFTGIGDLPGGTFDSAAFGVSADGSTVVGRSRNADGLVAVRWRTGVLVSLGDLPGGETKSSAWAANADGSVIVGIGQDVTANRPLRWDGLTMTQLPQAANYTGGAVATGISADGGTITGYDTDNQIYDYDNVIAYRIDGGALTELPYDNGTLVDSGCQGLPSADGLVVPGRIRDLPTNYRASYWTGAVLTILPKLSGGAIYSHTYGISADGNIKVGTSCSSDAPSSQAGEPCRWVNDVPQGLGGLPGGSAVGIAWQCDHDGSVVVGETEGPNGTRAFIWDAPNGLRDLADVLTNDYGLDLSGWTLVRARQITPDGEVIVGVGTNPDGAPEGWIARLSDEGSTACFGDGSGAACGCGNETPGSGGCLHGLGAGAYVSASGTAELTNDTLMLSATNVSNQPGLFFQGDNSIAGGAGATFGDGIRCCGQNVVRLEIVDPAGPAGLGISAMTSVTISQVGANPTNLMAGDTRCYQYWYRTPGAWDVCGSSFNLSNSSVVVWGA